MPTSFDSISKSILNRAHSIAVEQFHGMEQVGVRLPVGPHRQKICLRQIFCYVEVGGRRGETGSRNFPVGKYV